MSTVDKPLPIKQPRSTAPGPHPAASTPAESPSPGDDPAASTEPQPGPAGAPRSLWRQPMVGIGFLISILAIVTFTLVFDLQQVLNSLLAVSWPHVLAAALVFGAAFMLRSLRWQLLLRPLARLPFTKVRDVLVIGYMVNLLLPARMGEVARALALWRVTGASRRGALTTIGLARLFDGCLMMCLLLLMGMLFELPAWASRLTHVFILFMGGVLTVALWLAFHERSFFYLMDRAIFFLPERWRQRVVGFFHRFAAGTHALRSPTLLGGCLTITPAVWSLEFVVYFTMMRGFGITLPPWAALLAMVVTNIGIAAPSAPGALGVFEAACSTAVIALGLNRDLALSYAIGVHLMMFVCLIAAGQFFMWRLGLRMSEITRQDS